MAAKKKKTALSTVLTILVIVAIVWMKYSETRDAKQREGSIRDVSVDVSYPEEQKSPKSSKSNSRASEVSSRLTSVSLTSSRFDVIEGCKLIDHRRNDGDSFHVQTSGGREGFRLYYVDAPESAARTYGPGENNYKRIAQQGASMGGLNQKQTTEVGIEAKLFVKKLLKTRKFSIATTGEKVYRSHRKYAFAIVKWEDEERYLHELLVAHGLVRIHTKPMTLPDNTSTTRHKKRLKDLELYAKKNKHGAWGLR